MDINAANSHLTVLTIAFEKGSLSFYLSYLSNNIAVLISQGRSQKKIRTEAIFMVEFPS